MNNTANPFNSNASQFDVAAVLGYAAIVFTIAAALVHSLSVLAS